MQILPVGQLPYQDTLKTTAAQVLLRFCALQSKEKVPEDKDRAEHGFPFKPHETKQEETLKKHV